MVNNKKLGTAFEKKMCEWLADQGYWVHFIVPDARGAQPFDIIAVKNGRAMAVDCKTSATNRFSINRLEDNQVFAFERWIACGNEMPMLAVLYEEKLFMIEYKLLKEMQVIDLNRIQAIREGR